jgi:nucleoside 2-deoxyribosyltransferase
MPNTNFKCPLCWDDCVGSARFNMDVIDVECRRCGNFPIFPGRGSPSIQLSSVPPFLIRRGVPASDLSTANERVGNYLSIYTRQCLENGVPANLLNFHDSAALIQLAETYADTAIAQRPSKLLRFLEKRTTFPGAKVYFPPELEYPAIDAVSGAEALYYLQVLHRAGYVNAPELDSVQLDGDLVFDVEPIITFEGWQILATDRSNSAIAFVAMSFAAEMEAAFTDGIAPGIRDAGFDPLRVDKVHHNEKICDRIIAEIRKSHFLVADVTLQKAGVYFEAGFAMGLGQQIIWCCRKDDLRNAHFDTRQYNHIVWETPSDLRQQLRDRIAATIT